MNGRRWEMAAGSDIDPPEVVGLSSSNKRGSVLVAVGRLAPLLADEKEMLPLSTTTNNRKRGLPLLLLFASYCRLR